MITPLEKKVNRLQASIYVVLALQGFVVGILIAKVFLK